MSTKWSLQLFATCVGLVVVSGCGFGGSNSKMSAGKIQAAKKVALVGVCLAKQLSMVAGTKDSGSIDSDLLLPHVVTALNTTLPGQWKGVQVVPLAPGAAPTDRPVDKNRLCFNGLDPMLPGGYLGEPDKAFLGGLATKMDVDAVLVMSGFPTIRFWKGKGAKAFVASIGDGIQLHLVDRTGEAIAYVQLRDFETEYSLSAGTNNTGVTAQLSLADATKIGESLGNLIATGFAATAQGRTFEPPTRPGLSGL